MATAAPDTRVRWKSLSGVGLALLLVYGALNVVSAVVVPVALEARAVSGLGDGAVLLANGPEEYMLGTTYAKLHRDNPKLDKLLVDTMVGMCAQMMAMAVAFLAIAWFAARPAAGMVAIYAIPAVLGAILMIVARDTSLPVLTHRGD